MDYSEDSIIIYTYSILSLVCSMMMSWSTFKSVCATDNNIKQTEVVYLHTKHKKKLCLLHRDIIKKGI